MRIQVQCLDPDAPGPPVVLVHGAPDRAKNFAHVVHRLPDLAITVYDRRGYGRSIDAGRDASGQVPGGFEVHAADLIDILDGKAVAGPLEELAPARRVDHGHGAGR